MVAFNVATGDLQVANLTADAPRMVPASAETDVAAGVDRLVKIVPAETDADRPTGAVRDM